MSAMVDCQKHGRQPLMPWIPRRGESICAECLKEIQSHQIVDPRLEQVRQQGRDEERALWVKEFGKRLVYETMEGLLTSLDAVLRRDKLNQERLEITRRKIDELEQREQQARSEAFLEGKLAYATEFAASGELADLLAKSRAEGAAGMVEAAAQMLRTKREDLKAPAEHLDTETLMAMRGVLEGMEQQVSRLTPADTEKVQAELEERVASCLLGNLEEMSIGVELPAVFVALKDGERQAVPPDKLLGVFDAIREKFKQNRHWNLLDMARAEERQERHRADELQRKQSDAERKIAELKAVRELDSFVDTMKKVDAIIVDLRQQNAKLREALEYLLKTRGYALEHKAPACEKTRAFSEEGLIQGCALCKAEEALK